MALSDQELFETVDKAFDEAWEIIHSEDGWKEEKKSDETNDVVFSKKNSKGKKIYRIKIEVDCPPEKLIRALDSHDLTTWNKSLAKHEVIKEFPNGVKISYQVTPESGPGGIVSSRDFILAYKQVHKGNEWMEGGCSVDYPGPTSSKFVRAWNGPTGQYVRPLPNPQKCEFIWLMDCDFKGSLPGSVVDIAMPMAQFTFATCIRNLVMVPSEKQLFETVDKAYDEAWELIHNEEGWKEEKKSDKTGDVVFSRKNKKGKKIYRIKIEVDCPPEKLIRALENSHDLTTWNKSLVKHEIIKEFPNGVKVSYQVTPESGPGGVISSRDFILVVKQGRKGNEWMEGGCSVDYPGPENTKFVRAWNGPTGQFVRPLQDPQKCEFIWLMDCDFKGLMPGSIVDIAMPMAQFTFATCIRNLVKNL